MNTKRAEIAEKSEKTIWSKISNVLKNEERAYD